MADLRGKHDDIKSVVIKICGICRRGGGGESTCYSGWYTSWEGTGYIFRLDIA
jgi:hypothetical protein